VEAHDIDTLNRLLQAADAHVAEIARQRDRLKRIWEPATETIDRLQAQLSAAELGLGSYRERYQKVLRDYQASGTPKIKPEPAVYEVPAPTPDGWLEKPRYSAGGWVVKSQLQEKFGVEERNAQYHLRIFRGKLFGRTEWYTGIGNLEYLATWLGRLARLCASLKDQLQRATAERASASARTRGQADSALTAARALAAQALGQMPAPLQPWDGSAWRDWPAGLPHGLDTLFVGSLVPLDDPALGENAKFGSGDRTPYFLTLRRNLELTYPQAERDRTLALARSLLVRQLAAAAPGDMRMCFFDPVGLGQSVAEFLGLAEFDPELVSGKVWSAPADLATQLAELTAHIELVIQKYLRTTYETIDEFNVAAGEIAEPYRYLVVCDFPTGFTDETFGRLKSIMANGPRCGVRTLLLTNQAVSPGYGVDPAQLTEAAHQINVGANFTREHNSYTLAMRLDNGAGVDAEAVSAAVIDSVGRRAVRRMEAAVTFDKVLTLFAQVARRGLRTDLPPAATTVQAGDERTWWLAESTRGLFAPIGQKGARDAAILSFDSGDHAGTLLVGRPGSGKSTLLHTLVGGLTTLYSPRELELYLIDFKEGVEFKAYAEEGLPHARMVAIESDREFGLSVLQSLAGELSRRGELLRATGGRHAGLQAFREATGQPLSRILLVFDEFQVLFARNDKLGLAAASLLETIIRQGRGFGIHVLLGSQSLAGLDALGAHVPQLLPVRILLAAAETDARKVLGDGNDAGQYLTTHGDGILNAAGGAVEANERFKGALLAEPERIARLRRLRAMADATAFSRRPTVFEGNASVRLDTVPPASFRASLLPPDAAAGRRGPGPVSLRAGIPMTTGPGADIELRREPGANVLAVVRDLDTDDGSAAGGPDAPVGGPAFGLLAACVAAAALSPARIDIIDFLPADDGLDELFEPLLDRGRVTLRRRRAFPPLIEELRKEVRDRLQRDDHYQPARVTFLFGIHRARELDASFGSVDADPELAEALEEVLRDGPETGVHTWLWADTVAGLGRRLSSRMIRECAWRVAGKLSADDSLSLLGSDRAAEIRDRQLVLGNDDRGVLTRLISFAPPAPVWLAAVLDGQPGAGPGPDSPVTDLRRRSGA
jgi:energy-coupling factor transporter ATP-binding protein EcfA2